MTDASPRARLVALEGAYNLRDLGGYRAADGRTVRWGVLFRSDALHALTPADVEAVRALGLRAIYDLRKTSERLRQPTALPAEHGHRDVHLGLVDDPDSAAGLDLLEALRAGTLPAPDDAWLTNEYVRIVDEGPVMFGRLFTGLAEDHGLPALFHCAAGKDRTGLAAALLLLVLGVDIETVIADYELTNEFRANRRMEELRPVFEAAGEDVEIVRPFVSARRPVLEGALDRIVATHGSVDAYLTGPARVQPAALDVLRDRLLE